MLYTLLNMLGCSSPEAVVLQKLSDQLKYPKAKHFTLSADVHPAKRGESTLKGLRHPRAVGTPDDGVQRHTWVLPLTDPGAPLGAEVQAWVTPSKWIEKNEVDDWAHAVEVALTQGPVTWPVRARAGVPPSSASTRAVEAAERLHGLSSAEGAPIFSFTPE